MPIFRLTDEIAFPPPELANPEGLLAVGGDLRPERLLFAYSIGIFPWPVVGYPLLWHSPDPRMVLTSDCLQVSRSLRKRIRRNDYHVRMDTDFTGVIRACATMPRGDQNGTWITEDMIEAFIELHRLGFAHSIEAWEGDALVGGLYGLSLGAVFFGESMFTRATDASKVAFVWLVRQLASWGMPMVDCQVYTDHLASLGAEEWPRGEFLGALRVALQASTHRGKWQFDDGFDPLDP